MIGPADILRAIQSMLEEDGHKVYLEEVPQGFERPCVLIQHISTQRRDHTRNTLSCTDQLTICAYVDLDAYRRPDAIQRLEAQCSILYAFRGGILPVGNRYIRVTASTGGADADCAYVDLTLEYDVGREDRDTPDTMIQDTEINIVRRD